MINDPKITSGGVYKIPSGFSGTITIDTTEPVTIDGADASYLLDSHIVTTSENADLTIKDLKIWDNEQKESMIRFGSGTDNKLTLEGENIFDVYDAINDLDGRHNQAIVNIGGGLTRMKKVQLISR